MTRKLTDIPTVTHADIAHISGQHTNTPSNAVYKGYKFSVIRMFIMSKVSYRQHLLIALIVCATDYSDIKISRNYVVNYVVNVI